MMVVDFGRRLDALAEKFRWNDQIRSVRLDVGVQCLLDADRAMSGFDFDHTLHFAVRFCRIELNASGIQIGDETKLDDVEAGKLEAENVKAARLGGPTFPAAGAIDVAVPHIGNRHVLTMATDVFVRPVALIAPDGRSNQLPVLRLGFRCMAPVQADFTTQGVTASSCGPDPMMLAAIGVAARQTIHTIMTITFGVRGDQLRADLCSGCLPPRRDAMRTFRVMPKHDADAFERWFAAGFAGQDDMQTILCACNQVKSLRFGCVAPPDRDRFGKDRYGTAIDAEWELDL
ncbi:MAG: hypothetical protein AAGF78_01360 [Pseudomonadota bacterium]